jgi:ABC-type sulfate transport system substrate-binding protein
LTSAAPARWLTYLDFLYSPAAQKISARNFYWPSKSEAADLADLARFPKIG